MKFIITFFAVILCVFTMFSKAQAKIEAKSNYQDNVVELSAEDNLKIIELQKDSFVFKGNATYLKQGNILIGKNLVAVITDIIKQGDNNLIKYRKPQSLGEIYKSLTLDGNSN